MGQRVEAAKPRRARRIAFLRPVHLRTLDQSGLPRRMFAANLSRGGMFIRAPHPPPPGTRVEIFLEARGRVLRFAEATVAFVLPREQAVARGRLPGFGVEFTDLAPRSRALVHHLLKRVPEVPVGRDAPARRRPVDRQRPAPAGPPRQRLRAFAMATLGGAMALGVWTRLPAWLGQ